MAQRTRLKRVWVRLDCNGILHGSINWQLTLEEQAVWIKTFAYSAVCGGEPGMIQDNENHPLPHEFIASELHCPVKVFESMLKKSEEDNRLKENSNGIEVVNFKEYQFTEYDRQKPYREAKRAGKKIHKVCPECEYKAITNEEYCPRCEAKGKVTQFKKDYFGGVYGHIVKGGKDGK